MPASTGENQGEGQDLRKRQRCDNGVAISTRYEASTITTYYVSYSYYTPSPRFTDPLSEAPTPASTTRTYYTLKSPRPPISLELRTSTTWIPPKKSVASTTSEVIAKPRAIQGVPVTITRTIVTRIPVETIYSCPSPSSREPPTSRDDSPTSLSNPAPATSWIESTSRLNRHTSWSEFTHAPSTRHQPTASSREPWYHSPSTATSRTRPTGPLSTSPPPSTRPTSSIPPRTSSAPNFTTTRMPWPPTTTSPSSSECVYTLFDGTVPYGNYTASCTGSTTSGSWCTSFHRSGWNLVPCTSSYANTSTTTSTLTNTSASTQTITSWLCSSYVPSREAWVGVSCTSSINTTSTWPCSSYATGLEQWVPAPCTSTVSNITTSTSHITSTPTITMTPVTTTPTLTHSRSCSTYVDGLKTWLPLPCDTIITVPTIITIPSITITRNSTETHNATLTPTITGPTTELPTITRRPTASHSHCRTYISELELWVSAPCTTASPTPSMCLNDNEDMWVPCTSVTRTFDTDTLIQTITETSDTSPILITLTRTPRSRTSHTRLQQTLLPTITSSETDESTLTVKPTQAEETKTHTPTATRTPRPSSATSTRTPTSSKSLGSSLVVKPSSTREHTSTREVDPTTRGAATVHSTHFESSHPTHTSTRLVSPPSQSILTSSFVVPTPFVVPSPSSTVSPTPAGIQGGALAGVIVGTILGVVGLLGLGAFIMKSLSGRRSHDLFEPRGGYQAASSGGSFGGRDNSGSGVEGRGAGGMGEAQNESPLRSALRNRNMAGGGGGWSDASWNQVYAYSGAAVAAATAATTANNQRGRHSEANGRYADGGIRDGDTPDALPQRYADGGLGGPDSYYDTGISNHPHGNQGLRDIVSNSEAQFDPYHDLPVRQDSVPVGGNITRHSAFTTADVSLNPPGPTASYHSTPGNFITGHPVSTMHPPHTGVFLSTADGISTTSFVASSINQPVQPPAPYAYTGNSGAGGVAYQSPEPLAHSDIQRPPYWEGSVAAASVDSLPQHGNIPRYSAFTDAGNILSIGGSPYASGIGTAPTPAVGGVVGEGIAPQGSAAVTPTWNPVGVTEFGQNAIGSSSVQVDATAHISGSAAPDAPRNLHQGLTRLSTELTSAEGRDIDALSPRSASRASARPPRVGGPRTKPPRTPSSMSRLDSRRSLPPAYEERQGDF